MLANTTKFEEYYSGFAAYEKWIEKIRQLAERPNAKDIQHTMEIHFILWNSLLDARRAAFNFLVSKDTDKTLNARKRIIERYEKILSILENPPQLSPQDPRSDPSAGIQDMIRNQANILERVYATEKEAIHLIEKNLTD
jgi:hypothetical protein